jgi:ATP adenylyltransferase
MSFEDLLDFVRNRMRLSHVYQPVMLQALLRNNGRITVRQMAQEVLRRDESQLEYYGEITKNMVGRVLRAHDVVSRDGDAYILNGFESFSAEQMTFF